MSNILCCETECKLGLTYDDSDTNYAFNIMLCYICGNIYKEDVWENKGIIVLDVENNISILKDK